MAFSRYEEWRQETISQTHRIGYVPTPFGCRRHLYERLRVADDGLRGHVERQAVNASIQMTGADIMKRILARIWREQVLPRYSASLIGSIHDEVVFSVNHEHVVGLIQHAHRIITTPVPGLDIPIESSISIGINFGDQEELGTVPDEDIIWDAVERILGESERHVA
jgi:DNA polymerase I-like protein with 3'-5' exonuclease and polymerase domains